MCGLFGVLSQFPLEAKQSNAILKKAGESIVHRGPDSAGYYHDPLGAYHVVHRRLAVLDLSPAGHQPMVSPCRNWVLAFNGEIYNHLELRAELQPHAIVWQGHSDTETLLHAISIWGLGATLKKCVGMFALALWNTAEQTLFLARDRFGEKPLYLGFLQSSQKELHGAFVFASELKAIRTLPGFSNDINIHALGEYFRALYVPGEMCIYNGLAKLRPGTFVAIQVDQISAGVLPEATPYWNYAQLAQQGLGQQYASEAGALHAVEQALSHAVQGQSLADVPLGAFLSGGVDSSLITALMQAQSSRPVDTFTVGFDVAGYDESARAKAVAQYLGTQHHELRVSGQHALNTVPLLASMYCEPFADASQIPTYLVCQSARQHATVALSGDAGDELFGGYNRYLWAGRVWNKAGPLGRFGRNSLAWAIECLSPSAWDQLAASTRSVARVGEKMHKLADRIKNTNNIDDFYESLTSEWRNPENLVDGYKPVPWLNSAAQFDDSVARMMVNDALGYLPGDILVKVDRAAMAISLETRAPFLDHRVAEAAWRLPANMKVRNGVGKWALRQLLYKHVPKELIERPKAGFAVPLASWLRGPLKQWAESLLAPASFASHGLLRNHVIQQYWQEHQRGAIDHSAKLWAVLMFQAWYESQVPEAGA